jgi:hypothetical protein
MAETGDIRGAAKQHGSNPHFRALIKHAGKAI